MSERREMDEQLPARGTDRQSDLAVMDAEEYKNKRRLERLLDAHDRVEEWDNHSLRMLVDREITPQGRNIILLRAVKQFIREAYNSLREHYESYQAEGEPAKPDGYLLTSEPIGVIEFEHREDVEFYGLGDILNADRMYTEVWDTEEDPKHTSSKTQTHDRTKAVPEDVTMKAFLRLKHFLDEERGLDLAFSETAEDAGFEYSDLLNDSENPELVADGEGDADE